MPWWLSGSFFWFIYAFLHTPIGPRSEFNMFNYFLLFLWKVYLINILRYFMVFLIEKILFTIPYIMVFQITFTQLTPAKKSNFSDQRFPHSQSVLAAFTLSISSSNLVFMRWSQEKSLQHSRWISSCIFPPSFCSWSQRAAATIKLKLGL